MRVQHNIMAMNSYRNYSNNTKALSGNLEKLSSGYKINRAGDDAAGLAISEKMRAQITGLNAAQKNVKDGISLVKTAEGAMQEIQDMLNRMDYLATQSANGTYDNPVDRANLQKEVNSLKDEIDRIADSANFNGIKLLDGSIGGNPVIEGGSSTGIRSISVTGGNATNGTTGTVKVSLTSGGKLTFAQTAAVKGLSWVLTKPDGSTEKFASVASKTFSISTTDAPGTSATAPGTYTFKAVWDSSEANATAKDQDYFKDMVVTVSVGAAAKTSGGGSAFTAQAAKTVAPGGGSLTLQIGDTADKYNQLNVKVDDMHVSALGISGVDISDLTGAQNAIQSIKDAINKVSSTRGDLGAIQNRLDHTAKNLSVMAENIQDAESTIRDTDVAEEMMSYVKNNILVQSAQAMLAQANQVPQGVLQLLG